MPTLADSASGASHSAGDAAGTTLLTPGALSARGASQSAGDAADSVALPVGGLSDFGIFDAGGVDPAISCLMALATGVPDSRAYVAATTPVTYTTALGTLWHGAASAAVRVTWNTTGATAITGAQQESVNLDNLLPVDAADYRSALVYRRHAIFSGITIYDAAVERSRDKPLTGAWSGKLTNSGGLTPYSMQPNTAGMAACAAGQMLIGSVQVALARPGAQWSAAVGFYDSSFNQIGAWHTAAAPSTHPGGYAYQQSTVFATAPGGSAWVAVVPQITPAAIGDGEVAYVDCHRITRTNLASVLAPAAFTPARQQQITVHANRINQIYNPSFDADAVGWYFQGGAAGTTLTSDSGAGRSRPGAGRMHAVYGAATLAPGMGNTIEPPGMALLKPGRTYTASAYVLPQSGIPPVYLYATFGTAVVVGGSTASVPRSDNGFHRLSVTFTIPESVSGEVGLWIYLNQSDWDAHAANVDWWVDDVLVEEGTAAGDYFDGAESSPDYVWEGAPSRSRSHYYRDYRALQYRLSALVAQAVPLGVSYQLLYAQPDS